MQPDFLDNVRPHGADCQCDPLPKVETKESLLLQLKSSIDLLSSRMSTFESSLTSKMDRLEQNYGELSGKIAYMEKEKL